MLNFDGISMPRGRGWIKRKKSEVLATKGLLSSPLEFNFSCKITKRKETKQDKTKQCPLQIFFFFLVRKPSTDYSSSQNKRMPHRSLSRDICMQEKFRCNALYVGHIFFNLGNLGFINA